MGFRTNDTITPDLSLLIEEVITRPEWKRGDSLSFLFSGTGERLALAFDGSYALAPELRIAYHESDLLTLAADTDPQVEIETAVDGSRVFYLSHRSLIAAVQRGLGYQVEGSADLTTGSWRPLTTAVDRFIPGAEPGWFRFRYRVILPGEGDPGDTYFLRTRVSAP